MGGKEDQAPYGAAPEPERLRLQAVEYAMAVRISAAPQRLQGSVVYAESCPSTIGPITLEVKQTGERSAGNPHAAFDVAGAGNVAWSRWCDTRRRKGEPTGNTNIDLNRRVSPRPYCDFGCAVAERMLNPRSPLAKPSADQDSGLQQLT